MRPIKRPSRTALAAALPLPARALLTAAEATAREMEAQLWLVGGGVRDLAAGRRLHDLDLALDTDPTTLLPALLEALEGHLPAAAVERTDRFGTATLTADGVRVDLARLREEHYVSPGALPEVRPTGRIDADLARRDFTVNAAALGLVGPDAGRVVDPHGGLEDLRAGRLRVLHARSFEDDATRLWRGARTAALFGLCPDAETRQLIDEGTRWLGTISGERLWAELASTARRGSAPGTVERLDRWGVLRGVHPGFELAPTAATALRGRRAMPAERLAAVLLAPLPAREAILERFRAPRAAREMVRETARLLAAEDRDPASLSALAGASGEARVAAAWLDPARQPELQRALARWERTRPPLSAAEVEACGVSRGPALGEALAGLRRGRYLGTLRTPADARRKVRSVLAGDEGWD